MDSILISDLLVLLVEPSTTQQRAISQHLKDIGVESIDVVESGQAAIERIGSTPPDVVLSAMHLPDMTGAELVAAMKADEVMAELPFMLVSSETRIELLDPIRQAGAIAILPKPFELSHLRDALTATIDMLDPESMRLDSDFAMEELRMLLVDDSLTSRRHIRRVFENMGVEDFTEAENGREAIELVQKQDFDIIITDYNMPEVNGEMFVRYVREHSTQSSVPILMVTSESDTSRLARVEKIGVSAICDKPFDPQHIKSLIKGLRE